MTTKIYTTAQAAELLQVNIQTLRKWIREGRLMASEPGGESRHNKN